MGYFEVWVESEKCVYVYSLWLSTFVFWSTLKSFKFSFDEFVWGGVGWGVPTDYLVAPVLNWTGLGCDNFKPAYFSERFGGIFVNDDTQPISSRTRLQSTDGIRLLNPRNNSSLEKQSFVFNSVESWNNLPFQIRQSKSLSSFKHSLREWCLQNVPMR